MRKYQPLSKQDVINTIERKGCSSIPVAFAKWWGVGTNEKYSDELKLLNEQYPDDIWIGWYNKPGSTVSSNGNPHYRWGHLDDYSNHAAHSISAEVELLRDWSDFDAFLADFPDPNEPDIFDGVIKLMPEAGDRYKLGAWWRVFHESFWTIRGMENLMCDYYDDMDKLKILGRKMLDFHKVIVDRFAALGFDGIFTSDDLGHQRGPMMSPAVFKELYLPLYTELIAHTHELGMHFWLHSCGDNTLLLDYLLEAGLDVFHPVQKGCMDAAKTAETFGDKITFLYGIDVQHLLPEGSTEDVKEEIAKMAATFHTEIGGLILAVGNGIMPDTPLENIKAMLEAVYQFR